MERRQRVYPAEGAKGTATHAHLTHTRSGTYTFFFFFADGKASMHGKNVRSLSRARGGEDGRCMLEMEGDFFEIIRQWGSIPGHPSGASKLRNLKSKV